MTRPAKEPQAHDLPTTAEDWLARLHSPEKQPGDEEAFERWRAADAEHAAAYAEVEYLHRHAARLADDPLLRAVARAARRDLAARKAARPQRTWLLATGMAASLLLAFGLVWTASRRAVNEQHYASNVGLPQTLTLADGTQVSLDAQSSLVTRFSAHRREVVVERGRAQFAVAHDPDRPFLVKVDGSEIRDVGTTFQVSRSDRGVRFGLLQGRVTVSRTADGQRWSSELHPAEQMHIDLHGRASPITPLDLVQAVGWTHGQLAFRDRRLEDLLRAMNRYSSTQLRLGDPSLAGLRVSGNFHAGDQEALVKALARGWHLRAQQTGTDELTLMPASGRR